MSMQIDCFMDALTRAGIPLPRPPTGEMTILPTGEMPSSPVLPPILLTPSTPANTQEAEAYASRALQPPSQESIPLIDANKDLVADGTSGAAGAISPPPEEQRDQEEGLEMGVVAATVEAAPAIDAGSLEGSEKVDDAETANDAGRPDGTGIADETGMGDEAAKADTVMTPASTVQAEDVPPPPPPASQSNLQPPAPPLPPLLSSSSRAHTPAPSLPGPPLSPLPSQASRRSPRLQIPVVASPKEKRPRPDDEGRGTSKRRKE